MLLKLNCIEGGCKVKRTVINSYYIEAIEENTSPNKGCIIYMQGNGNVFYVNETLDELYECLR